MRHESAVIAFREIRRLNHAKGHQGQLHAYRCDFCGKWHVGHQPGRNGIGSGWRGYL